MIYLHVGFREELYTFKSSTNSTDIFQSIDEDKISLVWDKIHELWFENGSLLPYHKNVVCGDWIGEYCAGMGFLLWFLFNCAPHLILSVIDFAVHSGVDDLSSIFTSFPQILLSPVFTLFGFRRFKGQLVLSSQVSWTSCLITWLGCGVSLIYMADIVT